MLSVCWVSLGWALEGAILAWLASQVNSRILQSIAYVIGLVGISKILLFDVTLYNDIPNLFVNARFGVGILSTGLLAVQGYFAGLFSDKPEDQNAQDFIWWTGILSMIILFVADSYWTLGTEDDLFWVMTSGVLLLTGTSILIFAPPTSTITLLGNLLLLTVPLKIFFLDVLIHWDSDPAQTPFGHSIFWFHLMMIIGMLSLLACKTENLDACYILPHKTFSRLVNVLSMIAGISVVSKSL